MSLHPTFCPVCRQRVYAAEETRVAGKCYHALCLKCAACNKLLTRLTVRDHESEVFCERCHSKLYGPKVFGISSSCTTESFDGLNQAEFVSREPHSHNVHHVHSFNQFANGTRRPTEALSKRGKVIQIPTIPCHECGKAVYALEKVESHGKTFHKTCFRCSTCNKTLGNGLACDHDESFYCSPCYNRQFSIRANLVGSWVSR